MHVDGSIKHYMARLVAKGYTQIEGLDFHDTFAPILFLLSITVTRKLELHQLDIHIVFLHNDLDE